MKTSKAFFVYGIILLANFLLPVTFLNAQMVSEYDSQIEKLFDKAYENIFSNNTDSAQYYFNRIKIISTERKDWINVIDAVMVSNEVSNENNELGKVKNNLNFLDSLFTYQKGYLDTIAGIILYKNELSYQKGSYYFSLNDFERSRYAFNSIVKATEHLPDSSFIGDYSQNASYLLTAYSYLAKMYSDEGKSDLAKQYYEKNIRFLNLKNPQDKQRLYENYSLLAEVYKRQYDYSRANFYLMKTLDFNIHNKNKSSIPSILNIAQNHLKLSQPDSATFYLNKAQVLLGPNDSQLASYFQVSAEINQEIGNYGPALNEFKKALDLTKEKWDNKKHWEIAHILNKIGLLQSHFDHFDIAIKNYDLAMDQLATSNSAINQATLLKILKNKAEALNGLHSSEEYSSTITTVDRGVKILSILKPSFKSQADKLLLIEDAFPLFESGLEATYELYRSSKEEKHLELAFQYCEKSKAVLLMEALLGSKATRFSSIPKDFLERESQLKSEITFMEKQINNAKGDTTTLEDDLFDLKEEYRQLVKKIETDYTAYYNLKYNTNTLSVAETQGMIADDQKLISYFYGNDAIYAIVIEKNSIQMERIAIEGSLETDINKIHKMLGDPRSDSKILGKISYGLYVKLLGPFLKSNDKKKLIIIADGLLNYIPFAALNTTTVGIRYLAETHAISYSNSATLLSQLRQRQPQEPNILAFAPSFSGQAAPDADRAKLLPLPNNKREVEGILTSFDGRAFMDKHASLQNFKAQLGNFEIVHLATHAIFDDSSPDDSYLAFAPIKNEDNLLYVSDLYNLELDADMVTLSACESGVGELRRGEGFLSLARGFFYSGASSICSTLWKINDASSTILMNAFYKHLAKGDAKDLALQKAQVQFLNANRQNALVHPYYWSGFVISGNMDPVVATHRWLWIALGSFSLLLMGILWYRKSKQKV